MSRHFERDFATDLLTVAAGGLANVDGGPMTLAVVFRLDQVNPTQYLIRALTAANAETWWITINAGGLFINTTAGFRTGAAGLAVNTWYMYAVTKGDGSAQVRDHLCDMAAGTWTHADRGTPLADGTAPIDRLTFSRIDASRLDGFVAAAAVFGGVLDDAAVEALRPGLSSWMAAGPAAVWRLNDTPVIDLTGGGADQTAVDGTAVDLGQEPPGFSYLLGGPSAQGSAALSASGGLTAVGRAVRFGAVALSAAGTLTLQAGSIRGVMRFAARSAATARPAARGRPTMTAGG